MKYIFKLLLILISGIYVAYYLTSDSNYSKSGSVANFNQRKGIDSTMKKDSGHKVDLQMKESPLSLIQCGQQNYIINE